MISTPAQNSGKVAQKQRKIEVEYSMFDEQQAEDEDLEDIIEQPIEEESGEGDSEDE